MGMIVLAIVCGILANELFAWGLRAFPTFC